MSTISMDSSSPVFLGGCPAVSTSGERFLIVKQLGLHPGHGIESETGTKGGRPLPLNIARVVRKIPV
jgi:hypothetical protein